MYRLDWIEQLKLRTSTLPAAGQVAAVNPIVWRLGITSLLTDISAEMVNSMLPVYLVLHLHSGPLAFGAIDGIYHGIAIALLSLSGGILADRWHRHKELAAVGYGVSALCKLALLAVGSSVGWLGIVTAIDRTGKGVRAAPRDAILSLNSTRETLTMSFAIHRALDAGGTLIGPLVAFLLISQLPHGYDALWLTSFAFALLGFAVLWLFVDNPGGPIASGTLPPVVSSQIFRGSSAFRRILLAGAALSAFTVSDGFIYLLMQNRNGAPTRFFPLYYVITACVYMTLSIPVGTVAQRFGRRAVLLSGYVILLGLYAMIATGFLTGGDFPIVPLLLLGLFYAASEGILMAMATSVIPVSGRASGIALLITVIGLAKMLASIAFGWLWQTYGSTPALVCFGLAMTIALLMAARLLKAVDNEPLYQT